MRLAGMGFVGGEGGHPAYHASKGAVRIFTKATAVKYGPDLTFRIGENCQSLASIRSILLENRGTWATAEKLNT